MKKIIKRLFLRILDGMIDYAYNSGMLEFDCAEEHHRGRRAVSTLEVYDSFQTERGLTIRISLCEECEREAKNEGRSEMRDFRISELSDRWR